MVLARYRFDPKYEILFALVEENRRFTSYSSIIYSLTEINIV